MKDAKWIRVKEAAQILGMSTTSLMRKSKKIGACSNFEGMLFVDMNRMYAALEEGCKSNNTEEDYDKTSNDTD